MRVFMPNTFAILIVSLRTKQWWSNNGPRACIWTVSKCLTNAIKRRQCVKLSVRISECIFHFPMHGCTYSDRNKEDAQKPSPQKLPIPPRPRGRGCVYNLRFMWAMLTAVAALWESGAGGMRGTGKQQRLTRALCHLMRNWKTPTRRNKHRRRARQTHTDEHPHTHTPTLRGKLHNVSNVIYVSLINSLKCFNTRTPASIIKRSPCTSHFIATLTNCESMAT